jgi:copper homeostasis protein
MSHIKAFVNQAGSQIDILVGSGLNARTIEQVLKGTGAKAFHLSGKNEKESPMLYRPEAINMGLPILSEYIIFETDWQEIKKVKDILDSIQMGS